MGPRGNKQYGHADGSTCLDMVAKYDDLHQACALCKDASAICDTSNGKELPAALFRKDFFLRLRALTLHRFKAAQIEEVNRRGNNDNGSTAGSPNNDGGSSASADSPATSTAAVAVASPAIKRQHRKRPQWKRMIRCIRLESIPLHFPFARRPCRVLLPAHFYL